METWFNQLRGSVVFDDDVELPVLYEKRADGNWGMYPWMSLTPAELLTLRPGTKLARGHTVIAGLGPLVAAIFQPNRPNSRASATSLTIGAEIRNEKVTPSGTPA